MRGFLKTAAAALAFALCAAPTSALADPQPSHPEIVTSTVQDFMAAFDTGDEAQMRALMVEESQVILVQEDDESDTVRGLPLAELAARIAGSEANLKEPIEIRSVMIDGPVAMVWADYSLFVGSRRSHCGVDIFTLVREDGVWKIATITYSHITEPCEEAPAL
ncbi:MAG: nuclear transport factor 2 family protein [Erythrobacter sp.]